MLSAADKEEMLGENFKLQVIKKPEIPLELWQQLGVTRAEFDALPTAEIYDKLAAIKL